jgi:hypothetical protein
VALLEFKARKYPEGSRLWDKALAQVITNGRDRIFEGENKGLRYGLPIGHCAGKLAKHRPFLALSVIGNWCRRIFIVDEKTAYVDVDEANIDKRSATNPALPSCSRIDWPIRLDAGPHSLTRLDHFLQLANSHIGFVQLVDADGPDFAMMYDLDPLDSYLAGLQDTNEPLAKVNLQSNREAVADVLSKKGSGTGTKRKLSPAGNEGPPKNPRRDDQDPGGSGSGERGGGATDAGGEGQGGGAQPAPGEGEQAGGGDQARGGNGGHAVSGEGAGDVGHGRLDSDREWHDSPYGFSRSWRAQCHRFLQR